MKGEWGGSEREGAQAAQSGLPALKDGRGRSGLALRPGSCSLSPKKARAGDVGTREPLLRLGSF